MPTAEEPPAALMFHGTLRLRHPDLQHALQVDCQGSRIDVVLGSMRDILHLFWLRRKVRRLVGSGRSIMPLPAIRLRYGWLAIPLRW